MTRNVKVQVAGLMSYRARIEAYYAEHPTATQEQVRKATGAPRAVVRRAFDRLVAAGRVSAGPWKHARCSPE